MQAVIVYYKFIRYIFEKHHRKNKFISFSYDLFYYMCVTYCKENVHKVEYYIELEI